MGGQQEGDGPLSLQVQRGAAGSESSRFWRSRGSRGWGGVPAGTRGAEIFPKWSYRARLWGLRGAWAWLVLPAAGSYRVCWSLRGLRGKERFLPGGADHSIRPFLTCNVFSTQSISLPLLLSWELFLILRPDVGLERG